MFQSSLRSERESEKKKQNNCTLSIFIEFFKAAAAERNSRNSIIPNRNRFKAAAAAEREMNFIGIWIQIKHYGRMILLGSGRFYFCFVLFVVVVFQEIKLGKLMMIWIWTRNFNRHSIHLAVEDDRILTILSCNFTALLFFSLTINGHGFFFDLSNRKPFYRPLIWICVFYVVEVKRNEVIIDGKRRAKKTKLNVANVSYRIGRFYRGGKIDWLNQHQFVCWTTESTEMYRMAMSQNNLVSSSEMPIDFQFRRKFLI